MDKPGPRRQARRLPLIIERPDLTHPLRRVLAVVLTTLAWLLWLAMWLPFILALTHHLGYTLPETVRPSPISLHAFFSLLAVTPYALAGAMVIFVVAYLRETVKLQAGANDERWRPLGMERLATATALEPQKLAAWQNAKVLYVRHGARGQVADASTTPPPGTR